MRQPKKTGSGHWFSSFAFASLFAVGAAWYLDLLPPLDFRLPASRESQTANTETSKTESVQTPTGGPVAPLDVPQWEPEPAPSTNAKMNVTPVAAETVTASAPENAESPFYETTPEKRAISLSDKERVAKLFSERRLVPEPEPAAPQTTIVPASAEKVVPNQVTPAESFAAIDDMIDQGQYLQAHRQLSEQYWNAAQVSPELLSRVSKTAEVIYLSPQPHFMQPYEVQSGDFLQNVAPKYNISWEYLSKLNRVQPEKIRVGQKLKVIKGPFEAFVDLSDYRLTIHSHGYFVKQYAIGIGKDNSTPLGSFKVKEKLKNPVYYGSDGVIGADDPSNPLGERWVDLGDSYGIHGTIDPSSIGKAESRGCIRLNNADVDEVYDFLTIGTDVVIRP